MVGLGRHYTVELRGVTEQNDDGTERQQVLRACGIGEELQLDVSLNRRDGADPLKIRRKSGEQLGFVTPLTEVTDKLVEGRIFRVKLSKVYPHRGHAGTYGAVLDFEEVRMVAAARGSSGIEMKWIVVIGIVALLAGVGAAKLLGIF
jgi:hypothetical protein